MTVERALIDDGYIWPSVFTGLESEISEREKARLWIGLRDLGRTKMTRMHYET